MSIDLSGIPVALFMGTGLGLFYFGGLWLTVKRLSQSSQPALLSLASFFVRTAVALSGFYYVMEGRLALLLAAMTGFLIIRFFLVRLISPVQARLRKS
ncbi:MAG: ATP synthase subunit I [Deltaproteobacteria bacterium]|nr:ATP synthase subunit I [Deltaproteobacteria bacterium]